MVSADNARPRLGLGWGWGAAVVVACVFIAFALLNRWRSWTLGRLDLEPSAMLRDAAPSGAAWALAAVLAMLSLGALRLARTRGRATRRQLLVAAACLLVILCAATALAGTQAATQALACQRTAVGTITTWATGLELTCTRMIPSRAAGASGLPAGTVIELEDISDARIVWDPATRNLSQVGANAYDGWRPIRGQ